MSQIKSRIINRGDPCESEWPPIEPSGEPGAYYWCKETQTFKEGYPPRPQKFDKAPFVIQDTIDPYYHPAACQYVDSRSKLNLVDKAYGTITTDKLQPADPSDWKAKKAARKADATEALHKAVAKIDAGDAPLSDETKQLCSIQNEIVSNALNMDAYNVAGRKKDKRGKRFRRK